MPGTLFVVATPIGNLKDLTLRAMEAFQACDLIACEDTRVTSKLLAAHHITKPMIVLHEHTDARTLTRICNELSQGRTVAYVSDAGTPGVNDPGGKLVAAAFEANISVVPIPGPSAVTAAISVCGFPMDEFTYLGFVPLKKGRQTFFQEIAERATPSIFFESTHRIEQTLDQMETALGADRMIFVGRELTKMHETLYRGTVAAVKSAVHASSAKGEFVLIVGPKKKR